MYEEDESKIWRPETKQGGRETEVNKGLAI